MKYLPLLCLLISFPAAAGPLAVYTPECDSFKVKEADLKTAYNACVAKGGAPSIIRQTSPVNPNLQCPVVVTCK